MANDKKNSVKASLSINNQINVFGKQSKLCGTKFKEYPPLNDAPVKLVSVNYGSVLGAIPQVAKVTEDIMKAHVLLALGSTPQVASIASVMDSKRSSFGIKIVSTGATKAGLSNRTNQTIKKTATKTNTNQYCYRRGLVC